MKSFLFSVLFLIGFTLTSFGQESSECEIFIPNVMTPDCEEIGCEFLKIKSSCEITEFDIKIYNHWGSIIFKSQDLDNLFNCTEVEEGTYFYKISVEFDSGLEIETQGNLNVLK